MCHNIQERAESAVAYINCDDTDEINVLTRIYRHDNEMRVTLIDTDGTVIFDNKADISTLENHTRRDEFINAMQNGSAETDRYSETLHKNMYYYAIKTANGKILRLSVAPQNIVGLFWEVFPFLVIIIIIMLISVFRLTNNITDKIMRPIKDININSIDIDNISDTYEELQPFFRRIANENSEKAEMEKLRREFTANVSHELKTPLTVISGYAQMINNGMAKKTEDIFKFTGKIEKEASRMILLVDDIIKLSHLDEENEPISCELIDISEITEEIMSAVEDYAKSKNIRLYYSGEKAMIYGSRALIYELIYNLIDNAIKYNTENGYVNVVVGYLIDSVELSVKDTGIGIPAKDRDRIFERFYRVDKSHSKTVGGTGLGLSIAKHAAIRHNAEIKVDSELGRGTAITVTFKRADK